MAMQTALSTISVLGLATCGLGAFAEEDGELSDLLMLTAAEPLTRSLFYIPGDLRFSFARG